MQGKVVLYRWLCSTYQSGLKILSTRLQVDMFQITLPLILTRGCYWDRQGMQHHCCQARLERTVRNLKNVISRTIKLTQEFIAIYDDVTQVYSETVLYCQISKWRRQQTPGQNSVAIIAHSECANMLYFKYNAKMTQFRHLSCSR